MARLPFVSALTVLALQIEELLLDAGQLALQGLHSGPVVVLQLPQLLPVGLALGFHLGGQVSLGLGHIRPQRHVLRLHRQQPEGRDGVARR